MGKRLTIKNKYTSCSKKWRMEIGRSYFRKHVLFSADGGLTPTMIFDNARILFYQTIDRHWLSLSLFLHVRQFFSLWVCFFPIVVILDGIFAIDNFVTEFIYFINKFSCVTNAIARAFCFVAILGERERDKKKIFANHH